MERVISLAVGLALLFGVRAAFNKVMTTAVTPQPIPELASYTPVIPLGTFTPLVIPTPSTGQRPLGGVLSR